MPALTDGKVIESDSQKSMTVSVAKESFKIDHYASSERDQKETEIVESDALTEKNCFKKSIKTGSRFMHK